MSVCVVIFRWITQPIFGYIFDKKILNLDTEHLKQVKLHV